jgi:ABC-type branched-subunit amino acid transport system substrate-binding protein
MRLLLALMLIAAACTGVKPRQQVEELRISEEVQRTLDDARESMRTGKNKRALDQLAALKDGNLNSAEKAMKYNLKGVTLFNMGEVDKALGNFEVAEKYAPRDSQLFSQVQLNMAGGHFKQGQFTELKQRLSLIDVRGLSAPEKKKFGQLAMVYAQKFQNDPMLVAAGAMMLSDAASMAEVQNSNQLELMRESFKRLNPAQRIEFFEAHGKSGNLAVAYLAMLEADERYLSGDKKGALDVVGWLKSGYGESEDIKNYIKEFALRVENVTRITPFNIGLVLPLTGEKESFGQKALSGVDTGLKALGVDERVKIYTRDSANSPARGAQAVLELIREEKVAFIIGGLFPETAKAEYLEARKYGVLYISLAQVNLPKEEKNLHLIEVLGSIESQVEALLADQMIGKFGQRLGVIYPDNESGKAYMDEVWRRASQKNLQISSIAAFPKNTHDYRDTAQLFLGLRYPRERSEELRILEDVYAHERSSIRRVQTLPPVIDFDWVFMASFPQEAGQLIPTLGYYDATRLKIIGGPSWATQAMVKEQKNLGTLYFIGDDPKDINQEMINRFQDLYGKKATLIEILALDAMKLGAEILQHNSEVGSRDEFDSRLKSAGKLRGLTTEWQFNDGVWLKRMNAMTITRGEIIKLFDAEGLN